MPGVPPVSGHRVAKRTILNKSSGDPYLSNSGVQLGPARVRGILPERPAGETLCPLAVAPNAVQIRDGGLGLAGDVVVVLQRLAVDAEDGGRHAGMGGITRGCGRTEGMPEAMNDVRIGGRSNSCRFRVFMSSFPRTMR
jgi:hypothetical protein